MNSPSQHALRSVLLSIKASSSELAANIACGADVVCIDLEDTVTDKALGLGVLIVLAALDLVPAWVTLAIVIRDAVVVLGALAYKGVAGHLEIQPTLLGKTYTFVEFAMLTLVLGHAADLLPGEQWLMPMFALVFATTLASGIQYVWIWSGKARRKSG